MKLQHIYFPPPNFLLTPRDWTTRIPASSQVWIAICNTAVTCFATHRPTHHWAGGEFRLLSVFVSSDLAGPMGGLSTTVRPKFGSSGIGVLVAASLDPQLVGRLLFVLYVAASIGGIGVRRFLRRGGRHSLKWFPDRRCLTAGLTAAGFGLGFGIDRLSDRQSDRDKLLSSGLPLVRPGEKQGLVGVARRAWLRAPHAREVRPPTPGVQQTRRDYRRRGVETPCSG